MESQQDENICLWFGWEPVPAGVSPTSQPRFCARGTIPLFPVFRQKSDHAAYLTLDVLIPALLLRQIFQGTANLLSSAPADELSQHCSLRNPTRAEASDQGLALEFLWPGANTQGLLQPLTGSQALLEKLLGCPFEIKAPCRVFWNK